jgi:hypothetical protein
MTIVPAPGNSPADSGGGAFSEADGEGPERRDGFPPFDTRQERSYPGGCSLEIGFSFQSMLSVSTVARRSAQGRH